MEKRGFLGDEFISKVRTQLNFTIIEKNLCHRLYKFLSLGRPSEMMF